MHVYDFKDGMYNISIVSGFHILAALETFTIQVAPVLVKAGYVTHMHTHKYTQREI